MTFKLIKKVKKSHFTSPQQHPRVPYIASRSFIINEMSKEEIKGVSLNVYMEPKLVQRQF